MGFNIRLMVVRYSGVSSGDPFAPGFAQRIAEIGIEGPGEALGALYESARCGTHPHPIYVYDLNGDERRSHDRYGTQLVAIPVTEARAVIERDDAPMATVAAAMVKAVVETHPRDRTLAVVLFGC